MNSYAAEIAMRMKLLLMLPSVLISFGATAQYTFSPELAQFLLSHPSTSLTLSNVFAEASAVRKVEIYYFYTNDESVPKGRHHYMGDSSTLGIFVRENQPATDQCISILFELLNSKGEKRFKELWSLAKSGAVSKENFARETQRQEFEAVKATQNLIRTFDLKPEEIAQSKSYTYFRESPETFEGFLAYSRKLSQGRYQKEYEDLYDKIRKPSEQ